MKDLRTYGEPPFSVAVIHGGPGARGEMATVARELASAWGILEPLQTETSVGGQIEELKGVLEDNGDLPVSLIGFSWGAWLSFLLAAHYPMFVEKLILVGCGPFEQKYAAEIRETRLKRLSDEEKAEVRSLLEFLNHSGDQGRQRALRRFGTLCSKADACDPLIVDSNETEDTEIQIDIYQGVWTEAAELRRSGKLLAFAKNISCPVTAIHGDYDPHPAEGVRKPLSAVLDNFRFILLRNCGHMPWIERRARDEFYRILKGELQGSQQERENENRN